MIVYAIGNCTNRDIVALNYACFLVAFAGVVMVYQKTDKLKKLSFLMWPAADAFSNNFDATPPTILARLKANKTATFGNGINTYIKNVRASIQAVFTPVRSRRAANV